MPWCDLMCCSSSLNDGMRFARFGKMWRSSMVWCTVRSGAGVRHGGARRENARVLTLAELGREREVHPEAHAARAEGPVGELAGVTHAREQL